MIDFLKKLAEKKAYGIVRVKDQEVLVRFYEHENELVGAFWIPEEEVDNGIVFSAEIYRAVGQKDDIAGVADDLLKHIESLFEKIS
ncbi:MAG: hypothetical protein GXO59_04720 [Dictyoglomi bacterium]|jgi:hypothetical protein|nr:hypothetical protein [Dictyoglomota bacterium]